MKNEMRLKWKVFLYLCCFTGILLVLLWLFQVVFLDTFYRIIKTQSIETAAETISKNVDNPQFEDLLDRVAHQSSICVLVFDGENNPIYSVESSPDCVIHKLPTEVIGFYRQRAAESGGSTLDYFQRSDFRDHFTPWPGSQAPIKEPEETQGDTSSDTQQEDSDSSSSTSTTGKKLENFKDLDSIVPIDRRISQSMIYASLVTTQDGEELMVLLNSLITPVTATVETLRVQLVCITLILILLSLVLSLLLSRKIAAPIVKINQSAKELAKGDYDTRFEGKGYREISELNDTLNYAAVELSKVEGLRRELIANISHDLRTPLTMITGYAEVMRDLPGENTPENIQVIVGEAKRLTSLVNDLLDISKLQSGTQELSCRTYNLTQSVWHILQRYSKLTQQDGYEIDFHYEQEAWVYADEVKISQVIYNLINNAITYTGPDKKILVSQMIQENTVRVEVKDTGEGIPPDKLDLIWERYYKVDKTHKRAAIGTGLGLSIVKSVLELHKAQYGVSSQEGVGSTFWFELKLASPDRTSQSVPSYLNE